MGSSSNHPEYPPEPSLLINVSNFVSIKLSASNYKLWKTQMRCFIDNVGLLGFIDGTTPPPPPSSSSNGTTNDEYRRWRTLDQRLKGWILGSLSEEVLPIVVDFDTASDVWTELQHSFGPYLQPLVQMEENSEHEAAVENINFCRDMYRAAVTDHLGRAEILLSIYPNASRATRIASGSQTALHVAVGSKKNHFVKKFVESMITEELVLQTTEGNTALSVAAMVGNAEAAKILVAKHPSLLYIENCNHSLPMHMAAKYAHFKTLWYLLTATEDHLASYLHYNPFEGQSGVQLLVDVIFSGFFDIALYLVQRYPRLAILKIEKGDSPLAAIARMTSAFQIGIIYYFWKKIIYSFHPIFDRFSREGSVSALRDQVAEGRGIMRIVGGNGVHFQAIELVQRLCTEIQNSTDRHSYRLQWEKPILVAARLSNQEVVEEIVRTFSNEIWSNNEDRNYIILLAIKYRCKKVFKLILENRHRYAFLVPRDTSGNNILHIAAKLAPSHIGNLVSGAALQMQSELQWFQEVQKLVNPCCKKEENSSKETPGMVFTREHSKLVEDAKSWMKATANSYILVAALIATVVFATTITVSGGNDSTTGLPIFSKSPLFQSFYLWNAYSLSSSITSLLTFLSILTEHCAEEDFRAVLPLRLMNGLLSLIISMIFMMIDFIFTVNLVLGPRRSTIPFYTLYIMFVVPPLYSLIFYHFPLLKDVICSMKF